MLTRIELWHFKCFENLKLTCAQLNLLCGLNGTGKSSAIQALLLLRQSVESGALNAHRLELAGDLIDLGSGSDVIHDGDVPHFIRIHLKSTLIEAEWVYEFEHITPEVANSDHDVLEATQNEFTIDDHYESGWSAVSPFAGPFHFVSAERVGPRKTYLESTSRALSGDFGPSSSYALNYLAANQRRRFSDGDPRLTGEAGDLLIDVVDRWMQTISPGAHINLKRIDEADIIVAGFEFDQVAQARTRPYRPTNVGFGLSYTLPVILALLSPPGTLCLIENPEAHLHPRGQTKLGELAARAAKAGVQIFVETHSDHFMDGVRIAVRDGIIEPEEVTFNYFEREGNTATVTTPKIDKDGRLSKWPEGFFDQADENLARLLVRKG